MDCMFFVQAWKKAYKLQSGKLAVIIIHTQVIFLLAAAVLLITSMVWSGRNGKVSKRLRGSGSMNDNEWRVIKWLQQQEAIKHRHRVSISHFSCALHFILIGVPCWEWGKLSTQHFTTQSEVHCFHWSEERDKISRAENSLMEWLATAKTFSNTCNVNRLRWKFN